MLGEVLEAHATSRFVLILEDCHWMDSASWRLLLRVAQDYPQALIVLTSRPTTDVQEASALRTLPGFVEMKLAPLRPDAIALLVEIVLEGRSAHTGADRRDRAAIGRQSALRARVRAAAHGAREPARAATRRLPTRGHRRSTTPCR